MITITVVNANTTNTTAETVVCDDVARNLQSSKPELQLHLRDKLQSRQMQIKSTVHVLQCMIAQEQFVLHSIVVTTELWVLVKSA